MSFDAIQAIGQAFTPFSLPSKADPVAVDPSAKQQFAALLGPSPIQKELAELTIGTDLTAKIAGSFAQSINKLVNPS